jgi:hypothetical protein
MKLFKKSKKETIKINVNKIKLINKKIEQMGKPK